MTSDDSLADIKRRVREKLTVGEDETLERSETADELRDNVVDAQQRALDLHVVVNSETIVILRERIEDREADIDAALGDALDSELHLENALSDDEASIYDLLDEEDQAAVDAAESGIDDLERLEMIREGLVGLHDDRLAQVNRLAERDRDDDSEESTEIEDDADGAWSVRRQLKLWRLDLASSVNFSNLAWQFLLPAVATVGLILLALGVWVSWYVYPVAAVVGLAVGSLNYYRHRRREAKRLDALRQEDDDEAWGMVSILVKRVETRETTAYFGWIAGRRYAAYDRDRFVDQVSERAQQKATDGWMAPSILEKNAEQLADYYPDLGGFRDHEHEDIQLELLDRIDRSQYGIVPKQQLIEDVVETRVKYRAGGLYRQGLGYDPDLVRAAYQDLVPGRLSEIHLDLDTDDGRRELVAVESTQDTLPVDRAQVRTEFSTRFARYAREDPRYGMPSPPDTSTRPLPVNQRDADEVAVDLDSRTTVSAD